jgi:membrane protein
VYGAFAIFPIFLLWLYFSWLVILLGAVIAAALSHWRAGTWQQSRLPGWHFEAALRVLQELASAQSSGHSVTLAWLRNRVDLGLDEMEEILDRLVQANIVRRSEKDAWLLSRAPQDISAAEVFRLFVFDAGTPVETQAAYYTALLGKLDAEHRAALEPSLADLVPAAKPEG